MQAVNDRQQLDLILRSAPDQGAQPISLVVKLNQAYPIPLVKFLQQKLECVPDQLDLLPSHRPTPIKDTDQIKRQPLSLHIQPLSPNIQHCRQALDSLAHHEL
jgi:hypothetical protein